MFDPNLTTGEMAAARFVYAMVLGAIVLAIWRVVEAIHRPSGWNIVIAVVLVGIAIATARFGLRAWNNFNVDE
jgi:hypothetical protein